MVSVIIPVHNGEKFLKECLHSIVEQTYRDLEIIVIDDGSTDSSAQICASLAEQDLRIRLIQQNNQGVSVARNRGLECASGEYVCFVDADDMLPKQAVEKLLDAFSTDVDIVIGSHEEFRYSRMKLCRQSDIGKVRYDEIKELSGLFSHVWGRLFRRALITEHHIVFPEGIPYGEDTQFNLRYSQHATSAMLIDDSVYQYRLGGMASSMKYYPNMNKYGADMLSSYWSLFFKEKNNLLDLYVKEVEGQFVGAMSHYIAFCSEKQLLEKTAETLVLFNELLCMTDVDYKQSEMWEIIKKQDATTAIDKVRRLNRVGIFKKKSKRYLLRILGSKT